VSQFVLSVNNMQNACAHNRQLEPLNFTVAANIVLGIEVSTTEEKIIVEDDSLRHNIQSEKSPER